MGTDGGGSIRIPAAFCGVFGLKPTYGRVPVWPASYFATLSHAGPMARTVREAARMLGVLAGPDDRDWRALPPEAIDYEAELARGVAGLRIAFSPTLGFAKVDPEVAAIVAGAAALFADLGAEVELVEPVMDDPTDAFRQLWATGLALSVGAFPREARAVMDPGLVALAEIGEGLDHMAWMRADYTRGVLAERMAAFHRTYDLLLTPAEPIAAFAVEPSRWRRRARARLDRLDAVHLPVQHDRSRRQPRSQRGLTAAGLPVGLQVLGPRFTDARVLRACHAFEQARPAPRPPLG